MSEEIEKEEVEVKEPTEAEKILSGDYIPDGGEDEEEDEEKVVEKEIDPAILEKIAGEEEAEEEKKPITIPKARFDEAVEKERQRIRELEAELEEERSKKPAEQPKTVDKESLRELIKRRNDAQAEGDLEDAADLDLEIIEKTSMLSSEAIKRIKDEAKAEMRAETKAERQATLQERVSAVAEEAFKTYPFLNTEADIVNNKAIKEVKDKRDKYCSQGISVDKALEKAIEEVGPKYLEKEDEGKSKKEEREREGKRRNADASLRQPPSLNTSGNRGKGEPETDPAKMSRADHAKWWASLSETERQRQLGNID